MKLLIFISFLLIPLVSSANTYIEKDVFDHKVKVIKYAINSKDYDIKVVKSEKGESLKQLVEENNGITGINGVFFCPADYPDCKGKEDTTNNEVYVNGKKDAFWPDTGERVVFGWDKDKLPFLFQTNQINPDKESQIWDGFSNWPLLIKDGKNQLEKYRDLNMIDAKMRAQMTRNFICSDEKNENIMFGLVYSATIDDVPVVLDKLGCYNAINLDAGKSTAFIYNGKYLVGPGRNIINGLVISKNGVNVKDLKKEAEKTSNSIIKKIKKLKKDKQKNEIKKVQKKLTEAKSFLYNKYSKDIVEKNEDGEDVITGYEIEINDEKVIKKIYLINNLNSILDKYLASLK